jgi:hypothetical protein
VTAIRMVYFVSVGPTWSTVKTYHNVASVHPNPGLMFAVHKPCRLDALVCGILALRYRCFLGILEVQLRETWRRCVSAFLDNLRQTGLLKVFPNHVVTLCLDSTLLLCSSCHVSFTLILFVSEGRAGIAWEPSNKMIVFPPEI